MVERDLSERVPDAAPGSEWEPAPLARRFGALMIDWIASVLISSTFAHPLVQRWPPVVVLIAEYESRKEPLKY